MAKLHEIVKKIEEAHAAYNEKAADLTAAQIAQENEQFNALRKELQELLTEGANDCEGGHRPIGIFHKGTPNPFEIGDPVERNKRVRAATLEEAVDKWNEKDYLPPREPETVTGTHSDAAGNVISSKTVTIQNP